MRNFRNLNIWKNGIELNMIQVDLINPLFEKIQSEQKMINNLITKIKTSN